MEVPSTPESGRVGARCSPLPRSPRTSLDLRFRTIARSLQSPFPPIGRKRSWRGGTPWQSAAVWARSTCRAASRRAVPRPSHPVGNVSDSPGSALSSEQRQFPARFTGVSVVDVLRRAFGHSVKTTDESCTARLAVHDGSSNCCIDLPSSRCHGPGFETPRTTDASPGSARAAPARPAGHARVSRRMELRIGGFV